MPPEEKTAGEQRLCRRFLESSYYRNCRQLFCFVALPQEPETRGILRQALADGKIVAVPRCLPERRMAFHQLNREVPLEQQLLSGSFGGINLEDISAGHHAPAGAGTAVSGAGAGV